MVSPNNDIESVKSMVQESKRPNNQTRKGNKNNLLKNKGMILMLAKLYTEMV